MKILRFFLTVAFNLVSFTILWGIKVNFFLLNDTFF
jgi:hypothetical protein